jgi:hypothetical protein
MLPPDYQDDVPTGYFTYRHLGMALRAVTKITRYTPRTQVRSKPLRDCRIVAVKNSIYAAVAPGGLRTASDVTLMSIQVNS